MDWHKSKINPTRLQIKNQWSYSAYVLLATASFLPTADNYDNNDRLNRNADPIAGEYPP